MELDRRHGYLIQWLIGIGDMVVLNLMFLLVYHELDSFYTKAIDNNLREVLLLLNFCYFFSLYFVPIQLHRSIVYLDKIVQRAFRNLPYFSECRGCFGYFFGGLLRLDHRCLFLLACLCPDAVEVLPKKRI